MTSKQFRTLRHVNDWPQRADSFPSDLVTPRALPGSQVMKLNLPRECRGTNACSSIARHATTSVLRELLAQ